MFAKRVVVGLAFVLACVGSGILAMSSASATDLYWDSNGVTDGFGATNGTWGTSAGRILGLLGS
jgi:hypothetical protein